MKFLITIFFIIMFLAVSCEDDQKQHYDDRLVGKWVLTDILELTPSSFRIIPEDISKLNCQFADSGTISGAGYCNIFQGVFNILDDNSINIEISWTKMWCSPAEYMDFEEQYFQGLLYASEYFISGNRMKIITSTNSQLHFLKD